MRTRIGQEWDKFVDMDRMRLGIENHDTNEIKNEGLFEGVEFEQERKKKECGRAQKPTKCQNRLNGVWWL